MLSRLMTRREQFVIAFLAASIAVGAVTLYVTQRNSNEPDVFRLEERPAAGDGAQEATMTPLPAASPQPGAAGVSSPAAEPIREVVVSIQGAVMRPGVYTVSDQSRVQDLIEAAGGLKPDADTQNVNLAARLIDGTTLTIPNRESIGDSESSLSSTANPAAYTVTAQGAGSLHGAANRGSFAAPSARIDINRATQAELESLPGIGPVLAQRIIQYRNAQPFRTIQQLTEVRGIGPKTLEDIRDRISVQ